MRRAALYAASCWLIACGGSHQVPEDASPDAPSLMADAEPDATLLFDAGPDAEPDSGLDDGGLDADALFDANVPDALVCPAECTPSSDCMDAFCSAGECTEEPLPDATECGELVGGLATGLCLAGTCVSRGCGDGIREGGAATFREGCDDGNTTDGDGCSATCEPEVLLVDTSSPATAGLVYPTAQHPSMAADGEGRLLLLWTREEAGDAHILARCLSRHGTPLPGAEIEALVIDGPLPTPSGATPVVAGLKGGGWVVAWSAARGSFAGDALYRIVSPEGTLGPERIANMQRFESQSHPRVAPLGEGFVMVWHDRRARMDDPEQGLRARLFSSTGSPLGGTILVASDRADNQRHAAVASFGEAWLVVWSHVAIPGLESRLYGRRFQGEMPIDAEQFGIGAGRVDRAVPTSLGGGEWAIAWVSSETDIGGDVHARLLGPGGPEETVGTETVISGSLAVNEVAPSIAPLPGGEYVVGWEAAAGAREGQFGASPTASLPVEAAALATHLAAGQDHVTLTAVDDGTFFLWSGLWSASPEEAIGMFFLPHD